MKRNSLIIALEDQSEFIQKALMWANGFDHFAYFNPNNFNYPHKPFLHYMAIQKKEEFIVSEDKIFEDLGKYTNQLKDYAVGHLTYDIKNQIEDLQSNNKDSINAPASYFFVPVTLIHFNPGEIIIESYSDVYNIAESIHNQLINKPAQNKAEFISSTTKKEYIENVKKLRQHIIEGDIYEINYCQEFISDNTEIDPVYTYLELVKKSPSPFSVLYKCNHIFTICGSPERFLKKEGNFIVTQPIKGTAKRGVEKKEDEFLKIQLRNSEKEMAENMMIVDLCRNDLAKSCTPGSVKVEEMFGIYSFPLWHQMISTITGVLKQSINQDDVIKNAFPMGSMTGAPKIKVMQLIEKYESFKRGIYSGTIGYFLPNGDFDFNVVIRSIIYNQDTRTASFMVGGAITYDSDPEEEYSECMTKAKTLSSLFKIKNEK